MNKKGFLIATIWITVFSSSCLTFVDMDNANANWKDKLKKTFKDVKESTQEVAGGIFKTPKPDPNHPESTGNTDEDIKNEKLVKELEMYGGIGGGFLGRLFGKDQGGVVIAALIGSQGGKLYAEQLIQTEKKYKDQEDTLEASVNETKEINKATKEYNDSLNEKIITLQDDSVKIDKEMEQGIVDKKELDKHKEEVEKELAATDEVLKIAKTRLSDKKEKLEKVKKTQGAEFVKLEEQIKVLENEIVELEQSVDELTGISQKYGA